MYRLRELESKDIAIINEWRNNPELTSFLGAPFRYINMDVDNNWYKAYMQNRNSQVRCAIVSDDDIILGLVSLVGINNLNQTATINVMIGDLNNRNKGIGTFALNEMLNHAFNNLNLNRIESSILASNIRSQSVFEKIGFVKEGTRRQAVFKNGKLVDMHIYSILRCEYFDK